MNFRRYAHRFSGLGSFSSLGRLARLGHSSKPSAHRRMPSQHQRYQADQHALETIEPRVLLSNSILPATPTIAPAGVIAGYAFADVDGDGLFDGSESTIEGNIVRLTDATGQSITTFVDGDGRYQFDDIAPGFYEVSLANNLAEPVPVVINAQQSGWNQINLGWVDPYADLEITISHVGTPDSTWQDQFTNFGVIITNNGNVPITSAHGPIAITLHLSENSRLDGNDVLLADLVTPIDLAPGQSTKWEAQFTLPEIQTEFSNTTVTYDVYLIASWDIADHSPWNDADAENNEDVSEKINVVTYVDYSGGSSSSISDISFNVYDWPPSYNDRFYYDPYQNFSGEYENRPTYGANRYFSNYTRNYGGVYSTDVLRSPRSQPIGNVGGFVIEDVAANRTYSISNRAAPPESGRVFLDLNRNEILDDNEPWTRPGTGGSFLFTDLPANQSYSVVFVPDEGWIDNTPYVHDVYIHADTKDTTTKFLAYRPVAITGTLWNDRNADGQRGEDEPPLADQQVRLERQTGPDIIVRTDADGRYTFEGLKPGTFVVRPIDLENEWLPTIDGDLNRSRLDSYVVTLESGEVSEHHDFGFFTTPHISNLQISRDWNASQDTLVLTADAYDLDGQIDRVMFFRESNESGNFETFRDDFVGYDDDPSDGISIRIPADQYEQETVKFYAVAQDDSQHYGNVETVSGEIAFAVHAKSGQHVVYRHGDGQPMVLQSNGPMYYEFDGEDLASHVVGNVVEIVGGARMTGAHRARAMTYQTIEISQPQAAALGASLHSMSLTAVQNMLSHPRLQVSEVSIGAPLPERALAMRLLDFLTDDDDSRNGTLLGGENALDLL